MKKLFLSIVSMVTAVSLMVLPASAAFELDGVQAEEGDISSYVKVEEVSFGEPEPIAQPMIEPEELYKMEWTGELFDAGQNGEEIQPMADLPDLSVRNLKIEAGDMTSPYPAGMPMYYTFQLLNYGTADANGAEVIIKLDGAVATKPVPMGNVPAGKGGNIRFRGPEMTPGTHTMEIVVNPDQKITESNYNNNSTASSFAYKACFELVAVSMTSHKQMDETMVPTYEVGESVTFTMDFQNSGLLDVKNVPVNLYGTFRAPGEPPVTSQMGYTNYISELPAKTRMKSTVKLTFTKEASARISFVLDPEKILGDMDYSNNTAEASLRVAGGTDTKYALCIGVNKDTDPEPGYFAEIVQEAHKNFSEAGIKSTFNGNPNIDFLLSINSNSSRKQLASDVLFFDGHGNEKCMSFWSNNNHTGIYALNQETVGVTSDGTGEKSIFSGMMGKDFQNVKLANFIGCKTGDLLGGASDPTPIADFAIKQGAEAALGFHGEIYGQTKDSKAWIVNYAGNLANGYSMQEAISIANDNYPKADLVKKAVVFGNGDYRLFNTTKNMIAQKNQSDIQKVSANNILQSPVKIQDLPRKYILQEKATDHPEYTSVYALLKKLDDNFREEDYLLSVNPYTSNGDEQMIQLEYCIEGKIKTSKYYMLHYKNGEIYDITGSFSQEMFSDTYHAEKELLERVQEYETQAKTFSAEELEVEEGVKVTPKEKEYYYDYETGELKEIRKYILTYPDNTLLGHEDEILIP